jgi:hypothetical protein
MKMENGGTVCTMPLSLLFRFVLYPVLLFQIEPLDAVQFPLLGTHSVYGSWKPLGPVKNGVVYEVGRFAAPETKIFTTVLLVMPLQENDSCAPADMFVEVVDFTGS